MLFRSDIAAVTAYAAWLQDSNAILLDSVKTVEEHAAVLETKVDTLVKINEDIQHEVDSLQHEFASIDPTLIPPPVLEYIDALETQVDTLKTTVATQRNLISVKDTDIRLWQGLYGNEKERADSLQITLNSFPGSVPNTDKLFGFIPLPSRTVSFISGAAAATVGFIALTR